MFDEDLAFGGRRAVGETGEHAVIVDDAVLMDFDEGRSLVGVGRRQHAGEMGDLGIDGAGDEARAGAEGEGGRRERGVDRTARRGGRARAEARSGRELALGQPVDLIVEQQYLHVDIAPQHVKQVVAADAQTVAVAGDEPHIEGGVGEFDAGREGRRAPVDGVEPVGGHVIGKPRGTADPRYEHRVLARRADVGESLLHAFEDRVIAATGAPAHFLVGGVVGRAQFRRRGMDVHRGPPIPAGIAESMAAAISLALKGCPVTLLRLSVGRRYAARSIVASWPPFISGTSRRS